MSLGIWKKMAALLSVICISVAVNGCGPAAETPTPGSAPAAGEAEDGNEDSGEEAAGDEDAAVEDESGTEGEGESATE